MTGTIPARLDRPVLVFGGSGQVGRELVPALHALGTVIAPTHAEADLARPEMLRDVIRRLRPSVIINAAALTNVDHAEREPDLARQLNEVAPGVMADEARHIDAPLVHYSTDYVFDGVRSTPYEETDEPNPINAYGASKLAGERRVAAANGGGLRRDDPAAAVQRSRIASSGRSNGIANVEPKPRCGDDGHASRARAW